MLEISTKVSDEDFEQVLNILSNIPVGLTLDVKWISSDFEKEIQRKFPELLYYEKELQNFWKKQYLSEELKKTENEMIKMIQEKFREQRQIIFKKYLNCDRKVNKLKKAEDISSAFLLNINITVTNIF